MNIEIIKETVVARPRKINRWNIIDNSIEIWNVTGGNDGVISWLKEQGLEYTERNFHTTFYGFSEEIKMHFLLRFG